MPGQVGTMKWDSDANEKLLLIILATHDIKVDFAAVAAAFGPHCTPRAVQEQLKKLKKNAKADGVTTSATTTSKTFSTIKAASSAAKQATTPKKRKAGAALSSPISEDGEEVKGGRASKKAKTKSGAKSKKGGILNNEDEGDGGVIIKEEAYHAEDDLSDISAFDPADDQLTAKNNFSNGVVAH